MLFFPHSFDLHHGYILHIHSGTLLLQVTSCDWEMASTAMTSTRCSNPLGDYGPPTTRRRSLESIQSINIFAGERSYVSRSMINSMPIDMFSSEFIKRFTITEALFSSLKVAQASPFSHGVILCTANSQKDWAHRR